jgi:hypothetical protein
MYPLNVIIGTMLDHVSQSLEPGHPLLGYPTRLAASLFPSYFPAAVAGLTDYEMSQFQVVPSFDVNDNEPLGSVLERTPVTVCYTSGVQTLQALQAQVTQLQNQIGELIQLDHRTRGLRPVNIRTFLDAHLLELGYNTGASRPSFIRNNLTAVASALGVTADPVVLHDLYV